MSFAWMGTISTATWIAVGTSVAATAVSATVSYEQGQAQKATADQNAKNQRQAAISQENVGAQQAADKKLQARKIAAAGVAAAGAGGIDPSTGTPLTLSGQTTEFGELDSLRIINNASRTAWGYQAQAGIDEMQGEQAKTAGNMNAGATLLGGASSAYFGYQKSQGGKLG
jgi:heme exporter protein D